MRSEANPHHNGGPTGSPIRSSKKLPLTSINGQIGALNDGAHTGTTLPKNLRRKQRFQRADVGVLSDRLSERDWQILQSVAEHQFLTVGQIEILHFADHPPGTGGRLARRALARQRRLRLLGSLNRRIGGVRGGSTGTVHYIDIVGHQLLHGRSGRHLRGFREPSQRFVTHHLAVADAHMALVLAERRRDLELVECAAEPASWRRFAGLGGARLTVKADLYVEVANTPDSDYVTPWFIEVDLGTEGIQTLLKKCRDYEAYRRSGIEQERGGFPLVIWSMTHGDHSTAARRRHDLEEAIDRDNTLIPSLFHIIAPDELIPLVTAGGDL